MHKERILVVEDEEDILELVRYNLSREGYQAFCITSGEETMKIAGSESLVVSPLSYYQTLSSELPMMIQTEWITMPYALRSLRTEKGGFTLAGPLSILTGFPINPK